MSQQALFFMLLALVAAASARRSQAWSSDISGELACGEQRLQDVLSAQNEVVTVCNGRMTKCFAGCADNSVRAARKQQQKYICKENKGTGRWVARRRKRVACPELSFVTFDSAWLTAEPMAQPLVIDLTGDALTYTASTYSASASFSDSINGTIVTPDGTFEVQGTFTDNFLVTDDEMAISNVSTASYSAITEGQTYGYAGIPGYMYLANYVVSNVTGSSFVLHMESVLDLIIAMTHCTETGNSPADRRITCVADADHETADEPFVAYIAVGTSGIVIHIGEYYLLIVLPNTSQAAKLAL